VRPGQPRQVVGLIGYPLKHSISPQFQQAAFDFLRLPVRYEAWETPPERVAEVVERVRQSDCLGMNVTVPHKQAVIPLLDHIDERAAAIGAVNTIKNEHGKLTGYNTDVEGFLRPLREHGFVIDGARAVVIGAGGAARAVAFGLSWNSVADLRIAARRPERAAALAQAIVSAHSLSLGEVRPPYDLLVNTTPAGMRHSPAESHSPIARDQLDPDALVYDLVYNPPMTPLLAMARDRLGGLAMLVYQGAAAFEIWTGQQPPIPLMMARAKEALPA
jgi:shikimate dehydrogenase